MKHAYETADIWKELIFIYPWQMPGEIGNFTWFMVTLINWRKGNKYKSGTSLSPLGKVICQAGINYAIA
jgi:hypothetical protein